MSNKEEVGVSLAEVEELLREVYSDYESRKCKNCEYYVVKGNPAHYCKLSVHDGSTYDHMMRYRVPSDFGCIKFERRR